MKIGVPAYVNPETTTGGVALKFYSSIRIDVRRIASIKRIGTEAEIVGNKTRAKIVKNKFAPPFKNVEFPILFGKGISSMDVIIDLAVKHDIITKSGSWYSYGEIKIGQGTEKVKELFEENPDTYQEIENKVREILGLTEPPENEDQDKK
jgi:recombination protein RecA